jgi:hypothetical protein
VGGSPTWLACALIAGCTFDRGGQGSAADDPGVVDDPDAVDADAPASDAALPPDADAGGCASLVIVEAARTYDPPGTVDADIDFGDEVFAFDLPATLPVVQGNAGSSCAYFRYYRIGSEARFTCAYKGGAAQADPAPDTEDFAAGLSYRLLECRQGNTAFVACGAAEDHGTSIARPEAIETDRLSLRIAGGSALHGPTVARVTLAGECVERDGD